VSLFTEKIGEKYFFILPQIAMDEIKSNLEKRGFVILNFDKKNETLEFDCPSKVIDIGFWKCFSRKVTIKFTGIKGGSLIEIFRIPSLYPSRSKTKVISADEIMNIVLLDFMAAHFWTNPPR